MMRSLLLRFGVIGELFRFLWKERIWWMIPMLICLILVGALILFAQTSPIAPFLYTVF